MVVEHEHNLLTPSGYFDRFYEIKGSDITDKKVWEMLEEEYTYLYNTSKYSSYESFRVGKYRYLKKFLGRSKNVINDNAK